MYTGITQRTRMILLFILFIGLALRTALVIYANPYPERYIQDDAIGYNQLAINLVAGHGFSMESTRPYLLDNFRTPGYPLTIALIYTLFGYQPGLVLWLQAVMGTFTILLTFYLAKEISDQKTGLVAAILFSISPHSITYTALLWSDTEFTFFFTLSLIFLIKFMMEPKLQWALACGIVSGIAALTHPRALYLPLLFAILLIGIGWKSRKSLTQTLIYVGVLLLIFHLVLLPWRFRNYLLFGIPNVTSAAGINMLFYGAALTEAVRTGENQWAIAARYDAEVRAMSKTPQNPAEFAALAFRHGINKILKDPFIYAGVHLSGMVKIFFPGTSQINVLLTGEDSLDTSQIYALFTVPNFQRDFVYLLFRFPIFTWLYIGIEILFLCCIYFFTLYAITRQARALPWLWLITIILFYLAFVAGPAGAPRFRVAMMPLLCTTAACGMASLGYISRKLREV